MLSKIKKILDVIDGLVEIPETNDNLNETGRKIRDTNKVAYCYLLYCTNDEICFNLVDTAKTETLLDGDAALAWKNC